MTIEAKEEGDVPPSRSQLRAERKRVQADLDALAKRLASMSPKALDALGLDSELVAAVRTLAKLPMGPAFARQRRGTARMLRAYDIVELDRQVDAVLGKRGLKVRTHTLERWRARLLDEGDAALTELVAAHPKIDRQRLRQAVRAAATERDKGTKGRRFKALYQMLNDALP